MATMATDRFTRIAYTLAKPRKPISARTCRFQTQPSTGHQLVVAGRGRTLA